MNFSERIKLAMHEAGGMSQAELARQAGVTRAAVVHWMRCEDVSYPLKGEALLDAAKALRVSPYWLYRGEGPMRQGMVDPDTSQLMEAFRRLPPKARLTAVAQIKELADLISEKVNPATAEKSGTMVHPTKAGDAGRQTSRAQGVTKAGEKLLDFDEAVEAAKRLAGVEGASRSTETKGKKSNQSG